MKKGIVISLIIAIAFCAGLYFRDDVMKIYNSASGGINKSIIEFQKTDIGYTISQASKELLTPPPLKIFAPEKEATLLQSKIILETNLQRQANGNLPALKENAKLDAAASAKAQDMFTRQYFEHVSPSGTDPGKLVQSHGYEYIIAGENLILGNFSSEKELVQAWMDSPGTGANILNNRYTEIGVAIIKGTYQGESTWIGVQEFGLPLASCASPDANIKIQIDANQAKINQLSANINEKKKEMDNTNQNSPAYQQMADDYNELVKEYNALVQTTKGIIAKYNSQVNAFNACVAGK